jgi:flagellar motor protein MotB
MAAASARPIPCTFNTQQELDLKHVYEPRLNEAPVQNTTFNWSLTPIKSKKIATSSAVLLTFSTAVLSNPNECASIIKAAQDAHVEFVEQRYPNQYSSSNRNETVNSWLGWLKRRSEEAVDPKQMQFFRDEQKEVERKMAAPFRDGFKQNNLGFDAVECSAKLIRAGIKPNYQAIASGGDSRTTSPTTNQQNQSTQQQSQQAQQQAQQSQQLAAQNQTRADQARQGQRKTHDPAAEAHECVAIDNAGSGNFGAFKNICGYKVNFLTCNYKPRVIQGGFNWSADFDCERQKLGLHTPDGGRAVAAHNRNTELVYWFACKAPASPVDLTFVSGEGIKGRCHTVGGK